MRKRFDYVGIKCQAISLCAIERVAIDNACGVEISEVAFDNGVERFVSFYPSNGVRP
jgi:hypothetical protein